MQPKPTPLPRALDVHGLFSTERDVDLQRVNDWDIGPVMLVMPKRDPGRVRRHNSSRGEDVPVSKLQAGAISKFTNIAVNSVTNQEERKPMPLNIDRLKELVAGDTVAIRGTATLEPAGGPGDKIFPPTHAVDDKNKKPSPAPSTPSRPAASTGRT